MAAKKSPYGFSTDTEQQLAVRLAQNPKMCGSIIGALDIERIDDAAANLTLRTVWTIHKELGQGPSSTATIVQRLTRLMNEGSVTKEQLFAVQIMFVDTDTGSPTESEFLNEIVPILRRRAQGELVSEMALAFGSKGDVSSLAAKLQRTDGIGVIDRSVGEELTADSIVELQNHGGMMCPLGIEELDLATDGGMPSGNVGVIIAPTSGGKSMGLCHITGTAMRRRLNVALATLELSVPRWKARLLSNLTGVPSAAILSGQASTEAMEKFATQSKNLGRFFPKSFPEDLTSMEDVTSWVKELEQSKGIEVHMVVLDYANKLKHDVAVASKLARHEQIGQTIGRFRNFGISTNKWCWTAAQARRGDPKDKKHKLTNEDVGDSYRQVQIADFVISMVKSEDNTEVTFHVAKNRNDRGEGQTIGPLPANFACGRVAPIFDED